jgi:hypothetical protein
MIDVEHVCHLMEEPAMARILREPIQSLTATIRLQDQDFAFRVYTRPLRLGPSGTVQYYWMDSSQFRIARGRRGIDPINFRNCVGHWWRAMQALGLGSDPTQIEHLVLATTYPLVSRSNALQNVYRDAHLAADATRPVEQSLPEPIRGRIQAVIDSRDRGRIQAELHASLGRAEIPAPEMARMRQAFDGILRHGVELAREKGNDGLEEFLGRFDAWSAARRRKGGQGWLRPFLDRFSYECKASFYLCYANAWIGLIPWLRENRGLDQASERFLRVWHTQGQPIEQPDGSVIPDAFAGQVLALHPLSGFFMKDPALCAIAGRFIVSDAYERAMVQGQAGDCASYWDFVGAILTAAALYRQALDRQAERRGVRQRHSDDPDLAEVTDGTRSEAGLLEEFARGFGLRCPRCGGTLRARGFDPVDAGDDDFDDDFACRDCGHPSRHCIARQDLESWLVGPQ